MSEFRDDTFLSRWLNGELSNEEQAAFEKSKDYDTYKRIIEGSELIEPEEFDASTLLQKIKNNPRLTSAERAKRKYWVYAAAASVVILFGFLVYSLIFTSNLTTYDTAIGQKLKIELPDGSEVTLNANSSLSFSSDSWDKNRELWLEGEAYFRVKKGKSFRVKTTSGDVSVLGTQFTVKELGDFFEVMCFEGSVNVKIQEDEVILKPKTGVRKTRRSSLQRRNILISQPAWLANKSTFSSVPLNYVLDELENQYEIKFEGKNTLENASFNGTFPHDDLDLALKIVLDPVGIKYDRKGKVIVLSKN